MQYDKVKYSPLKGVKGFYYQLDKMANQMVEHPSDYSFQLRLFEGLPLWIHDMLLERNILPEFCTLEDICENARQIEELSTRVCSNFKGTSVASLSRRISNNPPRPSNNYSSNNKGPTTGSRSNNSRPQNERSDQRPSPSYGGNRPGTNNTRTGGPQVEPRNMYTRPSGTQTPRGERTRDNPDIECYRCHQKGHIS